MAKKLTQEQFVENLVKIHGYKYDYSKVIYTNIRSKIKIICKIHGEFEQTALTHSRGSGCIKCYNEQKRSQSIKLTNDSFLKRANEIHDNKYFYLEPYTNSRTKIKIQCKLLGHMFEQPPNIHLSGSGCPYCHGLYKTHSDFLSEMSSIDNNEYEYLEQYTKAHSKILMKHLVCGTIFKRAPAHHLQGTGCPFCSLKVKGYTKTSFRQACIKNNNGFGRFYIIRCFNEEEEFYKVGITSHAVFKRFRSKAHMPYNFEVIQDIIDTVENVWKLEKFFKRYIISNNISYTPIIEFKGSLTECFTKMREIFMIISTNY